MFKRYIWLVLATVFFLGNLFGGSAFAAELDEATRTVPLNSGGDTLILSLNQVTQGKKLFNSTCGTCHAGGVTKTNYSVGLGTDMLAGALPPRDNVAALVDFMNNPTTYDGLTEISEIHPSTKSSDVFPKMRNLSDDDLVAIAGYILIQPKVVGDQWGAGKYRFSAP